MAKLPVTDFYKHAMTWQAEKTRQAQAATQAEAEKSHAIWEKIEKVVREACPIEGIVITPYNYSKTELLKASYLNVVIRLPEQMHRDNFIGAYVVSSSRVEIGWELEYWLLVVADTDLWRFTRVSTFEEAFLVVYTPDNL